MSILLSLDLSTTCTGWSVFNMEENKLLAWGTLKPNMKDIRHLDYPQIQLLKMIDLGNKINAMIKNYSPSIILIEEIAGSRSRLTQKVLDGLHWVVLYLNQEFIDLVQFYDVSGKDGWRTHLELKLDPQDQLLNKENRKLNKQLAHGQGKLPIIDHKDLACRYVNNTYGLDLDPQQNQYDADIGDSIAMGSAYIKFRKPKE